MWFTLMSESSMVMKQANQRLQMLREYQVNTSILNPCQFRAIVMHCTAKKGARKSLMR